MWTDALGNPVTLDGAAQPRGAERFRRGLHRQRGARGRTSCRRSDDPSADRAGLLRGAAHVRGDRATRRRTRGPSSTRALAGAARATPREQRFIAAVAAWVDGDIAARHRAARGAGARASARPGLAQARRTTTCSTAATRPACCAWRWPPLPAAGRRALPARHAGLRLGAVPLAGAGRGAARAARSPCGARNPGRTTRWRT